MTPRLVTTHFGEPLSVESKKLVNEVRSRLNLPLHPNFDTDFNIYRFILNAERVSKNRKDVVESAAKALNEHLKMRKCMKLDDVPDIPFNENRIFKDGYLPCGEIRNATDSLNRVLWFIEYATISIETIAHALKSSDAIRYQFWQFEHMLRRVNKQEEESGQLSSLRHIIDMNGYEINPFTMLFVSSGTLSYYSHLFHYENYPELVNPIEMVNIAKWIHMPYRLIKTMMPAGFSDRFRLHDGNFLQHLIAEISADEIPTALGGNNRGTICMPAKKLTPEMYWQLSEAEKELAALMEPMNIPPRKLRCFRVYVEKEDQLLNWYFRTDGDFYFGVYYEPSQTGNNRTAQNGNNNHHNHQQHESHHFDADGKEMIYPWLKLSAKLVDEYDTIRCEKAGFYYVVFSNKQSWIHSRAVEAVVLLDDAEGKSTTRWYLDGKQTKMTTQFQLLKKSAVRALNGPVLYIDGYAQ